MAAAVNATKTVSPAFQRYAAAVAHTQCREREKVWKRLAYALSRAIYKCKTTSITLNMLVKQRKLLLLLTFSNTFKTYQSANAARHCSIKWNFQCKSCEYLDNKYNKRAIWGKQRLWDPSEL